MFDDLDDDMLNDLKNYDWEINELEDLTQSDCDHNCSQTPDLDIKIEIDGTISFAQISQTKRKSTRRNNKFDPNMTNTSAGRVFCAQTKIQKLSGNSNQCHWCGPAPKLLQVEFTVEKNSETFLPTSATGAAQHQNFRK
jgi:hypothetical protein